MKRLFAAPLAVVLAAGLIAAGCGDDDDDTSTTSTTTGATGATGAAGPPLSEAEFAKQGNAICKAGDKEIDAAAAEVFGGGAEPSEADQVAFVEDTVIPGIQSQIDAISALTPPEEIADDVDQVLSDAEDVLDEVKSDPTLLLDRGDDPFADVNKDLDAVGLTECADDGEDDA